MRAFAYLRPHDVAEAVRLAAGGGVPTQAPAQFLAGGTTILQSDGALPIV